MPRNDDSVPRHTSKLVFQQCDSRCAFCLEATVGLLDLHHIIPRRGGGSNQPENLIVVCKNCHARIETGEISPEEIRRKKRILSGPLRLHTEQQPTAIQLNGPVTSSIIAQTVHFHSPRRGSPRMAHPAGTIGARPEYKNYVDYLISRYYELRQADASYGYSSKFSYAVLHTNIRKQFGAKTFFILETRFQDLSNYLQGRINKTIQGRVNSRNGIPNYSSFDEYLEKYVHPK